MDDSNNDSNNGDSEIKYLMTLTVEELEEILEHYRIGQSAQ